MSLTNFKTVSAEELAARDAAQQLPPGCCPYVGVPQFNGATIRKCKISTTTAYIPAEFSTPEAYSQCPSKRNHDNYLLQTGNQDQTKTEEVNSNRMAKKFE